MKIAPPTTFRRITNERTKRLIKDVWYRLPKHDRQMLDTQLWKFTEQHSSGEYSLAHAGSTDIGAPIDGSPASIAEDIAYEVSVARIQEIESDAVAMFVIAHELAHVILRHQEMTVLVASLLGFEPDPIYSDADKDTLTAWHEEHANLQAWLWGFKDEMQAFFEAYPESPRPRWYVELEQGA